MEIIEKSYRIHRLTVVERKRMFEKLLDLLGANKEVKILVFAVCVTATGTYYFADKVLFPERAAALAQYKDEIAALKQENQEYKKSLGSNVEQIDQKKTQIDSLSREIARLQPYEQAIPEWRKALEEERARSAQLQEQLNQANASNKDVKQFSDVCNAERSELRINVSKLNETIKNYAFIADKTRELRDIENKKISVENQITALEGDTIYKQFQAERIVQLKRMSAEYQQQLVQLRTCNR